MKFPTLLALIGLIGAACSAGIAAESATSSVPGIPQFSEVRPGLYRGGQPTAEGMRSLSERGVRTIISLRPANEFPTSDQRVEEQYARANGIEIRRVPVPLFLTEAQVNEAIRLIEAAVGPVFIHCYYGRERTGVVIGSYRVRVQGWSVDRAIREAESFGIDFRGSEYRSLLQRFAAADDDA
jgi:tyrosine-protein phosphatase SIW14